MIKNYDLDNLKRECIKEVAELSREIASEGLVLLKNENILPFDKSKTVSVFGRTQIDYVKSGTGSGGMVNVEYVVNILDGLKGKININKDLAEIYKNWLKDNPFDTGVGWAQEPWSQKEMPVSDELCREMAEKSDYALVVIGRTAGEDRDNFVGEGSYLLTETEEKMIETVAKFFPKTCVALNTGNIIDMKWVDKYNIPCVLYCWQGGQEGGNALADVILGDVSPSGKLTDTIAYDINDYPSTKNFGNDRRNIYQEDIYVGYRYFETFCKDKVMYPFGFGLSYTTFEYEYSTKIVNDEVRITVDVKNTGNYSGKAIVQVYYSAPQGELGQPLRQLAGYKKTTTLAVGETETVVIGFPIENMASYDDKYEFAYILEKGEYIIYAGENVRDAEEVLRTNIDKRTVRKLRQVLAPVQSFKRVKPVFSGEGCNIDYQDVPIRSYNIRERMKESIIPQNPPVGNQGIILKDVLDEKSTLDEFISQLSETELTYLVKGEGMNSPKVTGGTGGCFGGVTDELLAYGIPPVCCTDGPSGIRMDTGHKATSIPNGTCLASSWNDRMVEELHCYLGIELRGNNVDILLGPGMNIHRNPLNGRNFEYFSEDPLISGNMGSACTRGLSQAGVMGTIKHFACNSQEHERRNVDAAVSERALREIYLKPFEMAVKTGNTKAVMTAYNPINNTYANSNYDLCTAVLRDEWGFDGVVMTDWWADTGVDGEQSITDYAAMVMAQNDLYMVTKSSKGNNDNLIETAVNGDLDLWYLRQCAKNILRVTLSLPAMNRKAQYVEEIKKEDYREAYVIDNVSANTEYDISDAKALEFRFTTEGADLAQYIINISSDNNVIACALTQAATKGEKTIIVKLPEYNGKLSFDFSTAFNKMNITILK